MPKMKTHSGTKKRIRVTGTGKVRRQQSGRRHLMANQPSHVKRRLEGTAPVAKPDVKRINKLLGQ